MSVCTVFFFSSRRRHTRCSRDWSSDVCSSDLVFVDKILNPGSDGPSGHDCDSPSIEHGIGSSKRPIRPNSVARANVRVERECSVPVWHHQDRKSTRLNSSHGYISYAVFCLKNKKKNYHTTDAPLYHCIVSS